MTKMELPDGLVDTDEIPEELAHAIASAISFLLGLSDHAGTFVHRDDGSSLFIIRDPDATNKFLEFYSKTFDADGEVSALLSSQKIETDPGSN
jgi:hypothetical protein